MKPFLAAVLSLAALLTTACSQDHAMNSQPAPKPTVPEGAEVATLAAGCFWCTEAVLQQLPGVISVTSGYTGGHGANPTYEQVCRGDTGYAEASEVVFDPKKITYDQLLETFWRMHDPTTLNRQGNDAGTQYRSAIFYKNEAQKETAEKSKAENQKRFKSPIVTEITQAGTFYPAESYHQDYYRQNKDQNPYCRIVIQPKLEKLGLKN